MSDASSVFCTRCGSRFTGSEAFCTACGAPRQRTEVPAPPAAVSMPAAAPGFIAQAGSVASTATRAYGTVASVAGMAGGALTLPWQTVTGGAQPDVRAFLSAAAVPAAHHAVRASLKRPGLAMALTATLDLVVAALTGGGALLRAVPRFLLGGATALFSLITGSKGGPLRTLTGAVSGVTAVVQLGFTGYMLVSGVLSGASLLVLVPQAIAMTSSLAVAVKTTSMALRRQS
ncbi:MAG: hypothetical protein ACYC77_11995 [Coriobacteriia bacterium]